MGKIGTHTIQVIEKIQFHSSLNQDEATVYEKLQFVHFVILCLVKFYVFVI